MSDPQTLAEIGRLHMENLRLRSELQEAAEIIRRLSTQEPAAQADTVPPRAPQETQERDLPGPAE